MPEFYFHRHAENATQLCGSDPDIRQLFGDCNGLHGNDTLIVPSVPVRRFWLAVPRASRMRCAITRRP